MKYKNAQNILPDYIIKELQKYINGEYLYIPKIDNKKKSWGENSGIKIELNKRNEDIYRKFLSGNSINELSKKYYLTEGSIRRIIRKKKKHL